MSLISRAIGALLGVSAYRAAKPAQGPSLGDPSVEDARERMGGQIVPLPATQTRWFLRDLESAQVEADCGILQTAGRIWGAAKRDGVLAGVLSTRTAGLVRLPKKFRGRADMIAALELGHESVRSVFDEMFPPAELASLADDGIGLGVGVAELLPVEGRVYPVMVRLPPENLVYRWFEDRWYYKSITGLLPITPGDGHWILHVPGGRIAPWNQGIWRAVGRAFINKEHALLQDSNWQSKLANSARVAVAPQGATDEMQATWLKRVMSWGLNTVFALKPGWDVRLVESNGRGSESFDRTVKRSEREFIISVAGQEVTTDGGAGFQNSDIHKTIRADLIKATADGLAFTINTQGLPPWVVNHYGESALDESACVEWDVTPPKDRNALASSWTSTASAIKVLIEALAEVARRSPGQKLIQIDVGELLRIQGIPVRGDEDGDGTPDVEMPAPTETSDATEGGLSIDEIAKALEIAKSKGLEPTEESIRELLARMYIKLEESPEPPPDVPPEGPGTTPSGASPRGQSSPPPARDLRPAAPPAAMAMAASGDWEEGKHPRRDDGKFGSGGGKEEQSDEKDPRRYLKHELAKPIPPERAERESKELRELPVGSVAAEKVSAELSWLAQSRDPGDPGKPDWVEDEDQDFISEKKAVRLLAERHGFDVKKPSKAEDEQIAIVSDWSFDKTTGTDDKRVSGWADAWGDVCHLAQHGVVPALTRVKAQYTDLEKAGYVDWLDSKAMSASRPMAVAGDWEENQHPRRGDGKFGSGSGSSKADQKAEKKASTKEAHERVTKRVRELPVAKGAPDSGGVDDKAVRKHFIDKVREQRKSGDGKDLHRGIQVKPEVAEKLLEGGTIDLSKEKLHASHNPVKALERGSGSKSPPDNGEFIRGEKTKSGHVPVVISSRADGKVETDQQKVVEGVNLLQASRAERVGDVVHVTADRVANTPLTLAIDSAIASPTRGGMARIAEELKAVDVSANEELLDLAINSDDEDVAEWAEAARDRWDKLFSKSFDVSEDLTAKLEMIGRGEFKHGEERDIARQALHDLSRLDMAELYKLHFEVLAELRKTKA